MKLIIKKTIIFLTVSVLTACGGGGGGESSTSTPNPAPSPSPTPTPSSYDAYSVVSSSTEMRFVYMTKRQGFEGYYDDHYCIVFYKMTLDPVNASSLYISNLVAEHVSLIIQYENEQPFGLYTGGVSNKQITLTNPSLSAENSLDINTSSSNPDDLDFTETTGELTLYIEDDLESNDTADNAYGCLKDIEMNVHALNGVIIGGNSVYNDLEKNAGAFGYPYQLYEQTSVNNPFLKSDLIGEYDHIEYEFRYYSPPSLVTNQYIPGIEVAQQTKQYIDGLDNGQYQYLRTFFSDDGGVFSEGGAAQLREDSYYIAMDRYYDDDSEHVMDLIVIMSPDKDGLITYDPRLSWVGIMAAP